MSKILQAMRKAGSPEVDYAFQLSTIDGVSLFPPPHPRQRAEFDQLSNELINQHDGSTGQIVAFASTVAGEGSSFVSYNLARHLSSLLDRKVAWIDANFRSPQPKLEGHGLDFRSLLLNPELFVDLRTAGNLVLIPHGERPIKAVDLLTSGNYVTLLEHFQRSFFYTIIDAPPIIEGGETPHLAAPCLGLVVVIESRRLKHEIVRRGLEIMANHKVRVLGSVLNKRVFDLPAFLYKKL